MTMKHACGAIIPDESTFCNTCGKKIVYDGLTTKLDIPEHKNRPNPTASGVPYNNSVTRYVLYMESLTGHAHDIVLIMTEEQKEKLITSLSSTEFVSVTITDENARIHILRRGFIENVHMKLYPHPQGNRQ